MNDLPAATMQVFTETKPKDSAIQLALAWFSLSFAIAGAFPKIACGISSNYFAVNGACRKRRVVPTYPLSMVRQFWHGGEDDVSSRQSQKEGRQTASLFQRRGEPPRGAEPHGAADGVVFGRD